MEYWGGADQSMRGCGCAPNNCQNDTLLCNCDINDGNWREDSGFLNFKDDLPVTYIGAGDTGNVLMKHLNLNPIFM